MQFSLSDPLLTRPLTTPYIFISHNDSPQYSRNDHGVSVRGGEWGSGGGQARGEQAGGEWGSGDESECGQDDVGHRASAGPGATPPGGDGDGGGGTGRWPGWKTLEPRLREPNGTGMSYYNN